MLLPIALDSVPEHGGGQLEPGIFFNVMGEPGHLLLDELLGVGGVRPAVHRFELHVAADDDIVKPLAFSGQRFDLFGQLDNPAIDRLGIDPLGLLPELPDGDRPGEHRELILISSHFLLAALDLVGNLQRLAQAIGRSATCLVDERLECRVGPTQLVSGLFELRSFGDLTLEQFFAANFNLLRRFEPTVEGDGERLERSLGFGDPEPLDQSSCVRLETTRDLNLIGDLASNSGDFVEDLRQFVEPADHGQCLRRCGVGLQAEELHRRSPARPALVERGLGLFERRPRSLETQARAHSLDRRVRPTQERDERLTKLG